MAALVVLVGGPDGGLGTLDVLQDLSAVGLLEDFCWVDAAGVTPYSVPAWVVSQGRRTATTLADKLAQGGWTRVRLGLLVPLTADRAALPAGVEHQVSVAVASATGQDAPIDRMRILVVRGDGLHGPAEDAAHVGWHNLVLAPQDAKGPAVPGVTLTPEASAIEVARHTAPALASLLGLWRGSTKAPMDDALVPPQAQVRLVRAFHRKQDARTLQSRLRREVLDLGGELPHPVDGLRPVADIPDVSAATREMAEAVWRRHPEVLRGPRETLRTEAPKPIGALEALRMLWQFMAAAIRRTPAAWVASVRARAAGAAAAAVHSAVFGTSPTAWKVVVAGHTADGTPAGWAEVAEAVEDIEQTLATRGLLPPQPPPVVLTELWKDVVAAGLTLADGGRRADGLDPVQVGSSRGIVHRPMDVAPDPGSGFAVPSGAVAARIGTSHVGAADVLGAIALRSALEDLAADPQTGVEANEALRALGFWQNERRSSFAIAIGARLAQRTAEVRREIAEILERLRQLSQSSAGSGGEEARQRRLARVLRVIAAVAAAVVVLAVVLGALGALGLLAAVALALGALVSWAVGSFVAFVKGQRALFRELAARRAEASMLEVTRANLGHALADHRRLVAAYRQYLSWSTLLGEVVARPFGHVQRHEDDAPLHLVGLPRAVRVGTALADESRVATTVALLRRSQLGLGWLGQAFEDMLAEAPARLGPEARLNLRGAAAMYEQPAGGLLEEWEREVAAHGVGESHAGRVWRQVLATLDGPDGAMPEVITQVRVGDAVEDVTTFWSGLDGADVPSGLPFPADLLASGFSATGQIAPPRPVVDRRRDGLGRVVTVVQVGEAFPSYELRVQGLGDTAPGRPVDVPETYSPRSLPEGVQ